MPREDQHTIVIGAGIVGVCCALYLLRGGARVTLVDRLEPGESASFGNAGSISESSCVPIAAPGLLRNVPRWLFDRDGPLTIRWRHLPALVPWLWRFVRAGNAAQFERSAEALANLHAPTLDLYRDLTTSAGVADVIRHTDYLHVYVSEAAFEKAMQGEMRLRRSLGGSRVDTLDRQALRELEPDLSPHYVRGALIRDQAFSANPGRLVKSLASHVVALGGRLERGEVRELDIAAHRVTGVRTDAGRIACDALVIAAGAWSHRLAAQLGLKLPLEAERGYHVSLPRAGVSLDHTIMETDAKFVATPMEAGLRFAGTVELASVDAPPDYARAETLLRAARRMFPNLIDEGYSRWMGCRPSLPDGLPVIGKAPGYDNVVLAFGHAHTGMSGAPNTGRVVAGLIRAQPTNLDLAPFAPERFR